MEKSKTALPLLGLLSAEQRTALERRGEIRHKVMHRNATLHEQGGLCESVEVVCTGRLAAYAAAENGCDRTVFEFRAGQVIGANLLFGAQPRYPMNIYCTEDCKLIRISRQAVLELLHDYAFTLAFVQELSANAQGLNQRVAMYHHRTLRENLLNYLRSLSAQAGSDSVVLPISKKQLADYLGVQRPSLFRELRELKQEGVLEIHNREIRLCAEKAERGQPGAAVL